MNYVPKLNFTGKSANMRPLVGGKSGKPTNIRMMAAPAGAGGGGGASWMVKQQMAEILKDIKPRFTGRSEDWPSFKRKWEEYIDLMQQCEGPVNGMVQLSLFMGLLDEVTKAKVLRRKEQQPDLDLARCLEQLRGEFEKDVQRREREKWEKLHVAFFLKVNLNPATKKSFVVRMCSSYSQLLHRLIICWK